MFIPIPMKDLGLIIYYLYFFQHLKNYWKTLLEDMQLEMKFPLYVCSILSFFFLMKKKGDLFHCKIRNPLNTFLNPEISFQNQKNLLLSRSKELGYCFS
jgi:hypothetical protein